MGVMHVHGLHPNFSATGIEAQRHPPYNPRSHPKCIARCPTSGVVVCVCRLPLLRQLRGCLWSGCASNGSRMRR